MRGPSCRAICVIGQAIPLVDWAGSLVFVVMATQRQVNLRTDKASALTLWRVQAM